MAVAPFPLTRESGSIGGKASVPHLLPYNASKFATGSPGNTCQGQESTSSLSQSLLTTPTDRAALRNNEVPPQERLAEAP